MDHERRIVAQAKRNKEHFLTLYDYYYPKLYAYVLSRVRHKERAEDIVADTFVKALDHLDQFTWRRSATFGSWLFRIAKNIMLDTIKKDSRSTATQDEILEQHLHTTPSAVVTLMEKEEQDEKHHNLQRIFTAMKSLTEQEQEIITLKYLSQMSYKEISIITGKKPNTLAVALRRALEKLRHDLNV